MAEYIDRDEAVREALDACIKVVGHGISHIDAVDIAEIMDSIPAADVVEVSHGAWLQTTEPLGWNDVECVECSVCHDSWIMDEDLCLEDYATHWHYCPTCGAKMDRERKPKETVSLVDGHIDKSNKCVSCGTDIPEGTWTCPSCDRRWQ